MPTAIMTRYKRAIGDAKRQGRNWLKRAWASRLGKWIRARQLRQRWVRFSYENPQLIEYKKPYRSPHELTFKLIAQGLHVPDRRLAETVIFRENYFRFKAYAIPFFDQAANQFHVGTSFDDLFQLYCADQSLRDFLLPILAQLEIRIRAIIDNVITDATQDPFWHLDRSYFNNFSDVERALVKAQQRFKDGKQEFVEHYRKRYFTSRSYEYRHAPPFWIFSEIFTLEQLLSVCKALDEKCSAFALQGGASKLADAAKRFGLTSYGALITNLKCILELRNLCAHHSRLWNRNLQNPAGITSASAKKPSRPNRLYSHLLMLRVMAKAQGITDGIEPFMTQMLVSVPVFARDMGNMGFPQGWDLDPIWK